LLGYAAGTHGRVAGSSLLVLGGGQFFIAHYPLFDFGESGFLQAMTCGCPIQAGLGLSVNVQAPFNPVILSTSVIPTSVIPTGADHREAMICEVEGPGVYVEQFPPLLRKRRIAIPVKAVAFHHCLHSLPENMTA
jgi:hypothetical protein